MDIIELPQDLAFSTRRPWRQWADGRWRRVADVDDQSYLRFRQALHAWASRQGRATAMNRSDDGAMLFQISHTPRSAHRAALAGLYAIWSFTECGWLGEMPDGARVFVKDDIFAGTRYSLSMALAIVGGAAQDWDRSKCVLPPLMAVELSTLPENPAPFDVQAAVAVPAVLALALLGGDNPVTDNPFVAEIARRVLRGDAR